MCGIIGYVGGRRATPVLMEGLRRLEYRGYDSAGLVVYQGDTDALVLHRRVGRVSELEGALPEGLAGSTGIAHTRWATHGGVTEPNAHPHMDSTNRVAVVHNGIIENFTPLKAWLGARGVSFRSETDSEVIAHLISWYYEPRDGSGAAHPERTTDPVLAVQRALGRLRGTWGLAVIFADFPDLLVAARNGSPMVVGQGDGEAFLASDPHALVRYTRQVVFLEDGEIARLDASGVRDVIRTDGASRAPSFHTLETSWVDSELGDYPHYMLKEIHEQEEALERCLSGRLVAGEGTAKLGGLELDPRELAAVRRLGLIGCGTAYHACQVGAMAIEQLAHVPATAEIGSEFRHRNPCVDPHALYLAVSQSGETADTLGAVREVQIKGAQVMGVVNVVGSSIARACGRGTYIHSGPEMAVASTKAFSNQVAALMLFTLMLARNRNLSQHEGRQFAEKLGEVPRLVGRYLADPGPIEQVVDLVCSAKLTLFLGRGFSAPVAAEGALKLMEVAYLPCLAYPSGEMKHGPIALLERGTPVIVVAPDDAVREKTLSNLAECRARGASIALIHTEGDPIAAEADIPIAVPRTLSWFTPLLTVLPLQLLAYKAGLKLGRDIDRPRNLAKSVTVE